MADHADDNDDNDGDIFVYRGGASTGSTHFRAGLAPRYATHVRIDKSVDEIEDHAFYNCVSLVKVETHDGIRRVGKYAFYNCKLLRRINLKSAVDIDYAAFYGCKNLTDVEVGENLETIEGSAFNSCTSLKHIMLSAVTYIGPYAFGKCRRLKDIELSERLEMIEPGAFGGCTRLQRIAIPLKRDLFEFDIPHEECTQFYRCEKLATVDLVGEVHKTVASLHMESWRAGMVAEINRINRVYLPIIPAEDKANVIRQWMEFVINKMDHYKAEHYRHVKEGITLLELALWKAKLDEEEDHDHAEERRTKKVKVDAESVREERRITCGADMVIKNVLPFLQLN